MQLATPKLLLLLLSLWGFYTLWFLPYRNGLLSMLAHLDEAGASIPGPTLAPMMQHWTGLKALDKQITTLTAFFYTAVDGNRADVSLVGLDLGGSVVAAWMLITVEAYRAGNEGKGLWWITGITVLGILLQNIGFACIAPLWMALHLATSPTVEDPKPFQLATSRPVQLAIAPLSVMIGYGTPSILMCLPAPHLITFAQKQTYAALQQAWPIWIAILQLLFTVLANAFDTTVSTVPESTKLAQTKTYLRRIYTFALVSAFTGHALPLLMSSFGYLFPVLWSPTYLPMLQPGRLWVPPNPFDWSRQATTLADGALWFLQWDFYTGAAAVLCWGVSLRVAAKRQVMTGAQTVMRSLMIAVLVGAIGPVGAAVVLVWSRDELVFGREGAAGGKKVE